MENKNLGEIIRNHQEWIKSGGEKGIRADFSHEDFHEVDLSGVDLRYVDFHGANFYKADLNGAILYKANLEKANLDSANLSNAHLNSAFLTHAHLFDANLSNADLRYTCSSEADLSSANLHGAKLECGQFIGSNLIGADLSNALLGGANLAMTDLRAANFLGAKIETTTNFRGARLPDGIYTVGEVVGIDSGYIFYDSINDFVKCGDWGCWHIDNVDHRLNSFKDHIKDTYGPHGKEPNKKYYKVYKAIIKYFEICRDEHMKEQSTH